MAGRFMYESLLSLPLLILVVWSLFLFDIAGDEVGFFQSIWIVLVLGLVGGVWNYVNRRELSSLGANSSTRSTPSWGAVKEVELRASTSRTISTISIYAQANNICSLKPSNTAEGVDESIPGFTGNPLH